MISNSTPSDPKFRPLGGQNFVSCGICGFMIESHIEAGAQKHQIQNGSIGLEYGKSITDECVSLEMTYAMLKRIILV